MFYNTIYNPASNKFVSIHSKIGKNVLQKYISNALGGFSEPFAGPLPELMSTDLTPLKTTKTYFIFGIYLDVNNKVVKYIQDEPYTPVGKTIKTVGQLPIKDYIFSSADNKSEVITFDDNTSRIFIKKHFFDIKFDPINITII